MMDSFASAFQRTNGIEGGYSDNPDDTGGKTKWGITEKLARRYGYVGDMRELPLLEAQRIAKLEFWDAMNLDKVVLVSYPIAEEMYDTRFNTGQCFLQRCLNKFNRRGKLYPDLKEDGRIGDVTIGTLKLYLGSRGKSAESVMLRALNSLQGAYYFNITDTREVNEEFVFGWFDHRVEI
jgi:lysozyme family protein